MYQEGPMCPESTIYQEGLKCPENTMYQEGPMFFAWTVQRPKKVQLYFAQTVQ